MNYSETKTEFLFAIQELSENPLTRVILALDYPTPGVAGNSVIVGLGSYTGVNSAFQYNITTDKRAKACYALSAAFSTSAVVSGGVAITARTCQISETAAFSEAVGFALMYLGNKIHVMALQLEGKPIPPRLQRYIDPKAFNTDGLGFIMPRSFSNIPFEKIGQLVGFGLAVYGYSKVIIVSYRYGQQFISKFRSKRNSKLIKPQAFFFNSYSSNATDYL